MVAPFFIDRAIRFMRKSIFFRVLIEDDGRRTTMLISRHGDIRTAQTPVPSVSYSKYAKSLSINDLGLAMNLTEISTRSLQMLELNTYRCHDSDCEAMYIWFDYSGKGWKVCRHGVIR